jgi:hypothetical protein
MTRLGTCLCAALLAACAAQGDEYTPPIHVVPGAAARIKWLLSHAGPPKPEVPQPDADAAPDAARVTSLDGGAELTQSFADEGGPPR